MTTPTKPRLQPPHAERLGCLATSKSATSPGAASAELPPVGLRQDSPRRWPRWVLILGLIAVVGGLLVAWRGGVFYPHARQYVGTSADALPADGRPAFLVLPYAERGLPPNLTLKQRLWIAYRKVHARLVPRYRAMHFFGAAPVQRYSVPALLTPCVQATGTRYLIAREAIGTTVSFGHSNTLSKVQWVAAVEQALRERGLLCLRDRRGVVKVIPEGKLADYRRAGLVRGP